MNKALSTYMMELLKDNEDVPPKDVERIIAGWGFIPPKDYLEFMSGFNTGEGPIGENGWLILFPIKDLKSINADYCLLMEQIPDYFLFGKDAADTGFAFHKANGTYHAFGLMSDFERDFIEFCGNSFPEFVQHLYNS